MNIFLDTNIIRQNFDLSSNNFKALFDFVKKTNSNIILLDIVLKEILEQYKRELKSRINELNRSFEIIERLLIESDIENINEINIEKESKTYKEFLLHNFLKVSRLEKYDLVEIDNKIYKEALSRALSLKRPFGSGGRGFKDCLIWLLLIKYCKSRVSSENIFISNNTKDFGNKEDNKFFPELVDDLDREKVKIEYYKSLVDFIKKYAEPIDYINEDWVNENLNWKKLASHIRENLDAAIFNNPDIFKNIFSRLPFKDFEVVSVSNIKLTDYFVYEFAKNDILVSIDVKANIGFIENNVYNRFKGQFSMDSIYRGKLIENFSPMTSQLF